MFYDQDNGPTREQLHAELDRILDQGRAERSGDEGWPTIPGDLTNDLQGFFVAVGDATAQRDLDKHSPLTIIVHDRTKGRFPGAWVDAPNQVEDLGSALRTLEAARALSGIAHELQRDAAFFLDQPARFGKKITETAMDEKIPNATTQAAIDEARAMRKDQD
jgi:hypothetical protein